MMKAVARIGRKKNSRPFKHYYEQWIDSLKNILLQLLRRSMLAYSANLLTTHVEMLHHHFQAYYETLDLAASADVAQLLYPDYRNSLEKPFLWFGDFHPNLFTTLLRSFLDDESDDCDHYDHSNKSMQFILAWKNPSKALITQIEQIECGLRLMVPSLIARGRTAQNAFIERLAADWMSCQARKEASKAIGKTMTSHMDELMSCFLDANRLRRSILTEIMGATDVYQAALYLEALAEFFVGFRDTELLGEFKQFKGLLS